MRSSVVVGGVDDVGSGCGLIGNWMPGLLGDCGMECGEDRHEEQDRHDEHQLQVSSNAFSGFSGRSEMVSLVMAFSLGVAWIHGYDGVVFSGGGAVCAYPGLRSVYGWVHGWIHGCGCGLASGDCGAPHRNSNVMRDMASVASQTAANTQPRT